MHLGRLAKDNNIRIPDDWIMRFGRAETAVKLPDGGYLGMLTAYHEIHCVVSPILLKLQTRCPGKAQTRAGKEKREKGRDCVYESDWLTQPDLLSYRNDCTSRYIGNTTCPTRRPRSSR